MTKDEIRSKILNERLSLTPGKANEISQIIQDRLAKSAIWPKSGRIGLYASVKNEVLTLDLFKMALEQGLHVYFPRVEQGIQFYEVNGPEDLQRGSWSIPEPKKECPMLPEDELQLLDLLVVPGIGFTKDCHRIGYGKGFYDQFMSHYFGRTVGLAYELQMLDNFPVDSWDRPLSWVVTEKNIYQSK